MFINKEGVCIFAAKENINRNIQLFPADYEYNKVISVEAYSVRPIDSSASSSWVPARWFFNYKDTTIDNSGSNYGFGLDLLGFTNNLDKDINVVKNYSLKNNENYLQIALKTSAAAPQAAGVGALILSKFLSPELRANFLNYEIDPPLPIIWLAPEDVQGLLCISARDLNFDYVSKEGDTLVYHDTSGYDAETGYGMLRGGETMINMLPPYHLHHYKAIGGNIVDSICFDDFTVLTPARGEPLLTPSIPDSIEYKAILYKVQKKIILNGLDTARTWGRGGIGTTGWSGVQPTDPEGNCKDSATGYCRVVGDAMPGYTNFNPNNIRDISFRNDTITLETYCYKVYNKLDSNKYLGWFPTHPDSVVYRFTVWGKLSDTTVGIKDNYFAKYPAYKIKCEAHQISRGNSIKIQYQVDDINEIKLYIFDSIGKLVYSDNIYPEFIKTQNTLLINIPTIQSGTYYVLLSSDKDIGFCNFALIK